MKKKNRTPFLWLGSLLCLAVLLSACSSNSTAYDAAAPQAENSMPQSAEALEKESQAYSSDIPAVQESKIIYEGTIEMETASFDETMEIINRTAEEAGGYIASSELGTRMVVQSREYRYYNVTIKVPVERYKETFQYLQSLELGAYSIESAQDVTDKYYDTEGRLKTRRVEEERVLEMISRAETIEELLQLEQRLGEIRMDIELYEARLNSLERSSSYSTITIRVMEKDAEGIVVIADDFGSKLKQGFTSSIRWTVDFFQAVILFAVRISIPGLIIAVLALFGVLVWRVVKRK